MRMVKIEDRMTLKIDGTGQIWEFAPPKSWQHTNTQGECLAFFVSPLGQVGVSCGNWEGVPYIHASLVKAEGLPTYEEMCALKDAVFGPNRYACQIHPPESEHVNIHSRCLHLWGPLRPAQWPLPKFGRHGTI